MLFSLICYKNWVCFYTIYYSNFSYLDFGDFFALSFSITLSFILLLWVKEMAEFNREEYFAANNIESTSVGKKYGGLVPKKKPLISKDNERAFFDSADWALCKQGAGMNQQSTAAVETLRPKLQRTPHQQLPPRRPACTSG
ncbi:cAMP-regulated phosphoprotein-like protein [Medicago truncatula]|uniref:cAMP-regulated phosphoprotein-like protein n=1 Tax=Medicago truncatula TaxID=3880 RepID=A0A072V6A6_MEDTR|nr:cAMP-regulated phosphoprotein-like protein [Medicago truncatula]